MYVLILGVMFSSITSLVELNKHADLSAYLEIEF